MMGYQEKGSFLSCAEVRHCRENEVSKYSDLSKTEDEKFKNEPSSVHTSVCSTHASEELHPCPCFDTMLLLVVVVKLKVNCCCLGIAYAKPMWPLAPNRNT